MTVNITASEDTAVNSELSDAELATLGTSETHFKSIEKRELSSEISWETWERNINAHFNQVREGGSKSIHLGTNDGCNLRRRISF